MITQSELKELLHYDSETGKLTWLKSIGNKRPNDLAGCVRCEKYNKKYLYIGINKKAYYAHRLIWMYVYGKFPDQEIDHIDGDGLNNKISNLRDADRSTNQKNQKLFKTNKSGHCGVYGRYGKWIAQIKVSDKCMHLGTFVSFDDAVVARKSAEKVYGFHPNHGKSSENVIT